MALPPVYSVDSVVNNAYVGGWCHPANHAAYLPDRVYSQRRVRRCRTFVATALMRILECTALLTFDLNLTSEAKPLNVSLSGNPPTSSRPMTSGGNLGLKCLHASLVPDSSRVNVFFQGFSALILLFEFS